MLLGPGARARIAAVATLIAVFLFTLPLIVAVGNDDPASLPQTIWLQVAVPLLWIARFAMKRSPGPHRISRFFGPVVAFLAWSALSTLWATDFFASERVLFLWVAAVGLAFLIANTIESSAHARRLLLALFWASVVVSGIGLAQHLGGWNGLPQAFPPAGTMGNKNVAAGFVAVMAPLGVAAFAAATTGASFLAISVATALAFVVHAGCRAAGLALGAQLVLALSFLPVRDLVSRWPRTKWRALCAGVVVFLCLSAMAPAELSPVQEATSGLPVVGSESPEPLAPVEGAYRSVAIRIGIWRNALEMIRAAPFRGVGIGNFPVHYPRFANDAPDHTRIEERVESAHNDYVQLTAELGLLGAGLLGWLALLTVRAVAKAFREASSHDQPFYLATGLGLLGLLVLAAASPTVYQPVSLAAAATFTGVVLAAHSHAQGASPAEKGRKETGWRYGSTLGFVGASALLVAACSWGLAQIQADRHVLRMGMAEARGDWPAVVREGLAARRLNPGRAGTRFGTASAMLRLGQTREAAEMLEEFAAVDPYNVNALGNLGIAYATLGDLKQATACFERVLSLRPGDRFAREELRRIMARTKVARGEVS